MNNQLRLIKANFLTAICLVIMTIPVIWGISLHLLAALYVISIILSVIIARIKINDLVKLQLKILPVFIAIGVLSIFYDNGFTFLITLIVKISYFLFLSLIVQHSFEYLTEYDVLIQNNVFLRFYAYLTVYFHMIRKSAARYTLKDYLSISLIAELFTNCLQDAAEISIKKKTPSNFEVRIFINNLFLIVLSSVALLIRILRLQ